MTNESVNSNDAPGSATRGSDRADQISTEDTPRDEQPTDGDSGYRLADAEPPPVEAPSPAPPEPIAEVKKPEVETTFQPSAEPIAETSNETFPERAPEVR